MKRLLLLVGLLFALLGSAMAVVNINTRDQRITRCVERHRTGGRGHHRLPRPECPFKSVDDLTNVKGIGPKTLEDIRKDVSIIYATAAIQTGRDNCGTVAGRRSDPTAPVNGQGGQARQGRCQERIAESQRQKD